MMAGADSVSVEGCRYGRLSEFFQADLFITGNIAESCPHKTEALCLHLCHTVTENTFNFIPWGKSHCPEAKLAELGYKPSKSTHSQLHLAFDMSGCERSCLITACRCKFPPEGYKVWKDDKSHQRAPVGTRDHTRVATVAQDTMTLR